MNSVKAINEAIQNLPEGEHTRLISDKYHTFEELYDHRIQLYIALCSVLCEQSEYNPYVWRSKTHSDGTSFKGWFILGIGKKKGTQITYHLPISKWNECEFAETLDSAPEWDNHTSTNVLERLKAFF